MTLADSAGWAFAVTAVCAVLARLVGALTTDGAVAGAVVGACVSAGFGLQGLAVLGTFFVVGTLATRIGWKTKKARGTAEAGEGRRDWKRVVGKGGVAAACALMYWLTLQLGITHPNMWDWALAFTGALAAAVADTLGTEIGTLASSPPRALPSLRRVPVGTPGAVSAAGTTGAAAGATVIAIVAWPTGFVSTVGEGLGVVAAGLFASLAESVAVGVGLRAPGFVRNVITTAVGAVLWWFIYQQLASWPLRRYAW
jgi:uncharacterized protein (TIGR00297 family)